LVTISHQTPPNPTPIICVLCKAETENYCPRSCE
jgi:hypothetical protein